MYHRSPAIDHVSSDPNALKYANQISVYSRFHPFSPRSCRYVRAGLEARHRDPDRRLGQSHSRSARAAGERLLAADT